MGYEPYYLKLYKNSELDERIEKLYKVLENCTLCPRRCEKNRLQDEKGVCRAGKDTEISSYGPHFGEEEPLVGSSRLFIPRLGKLTPAGGSGTIFLTNCNLKCIFCQNYDISHQGMGTLVSSERVARMMIELQEVGCHNINFVTPTHYTPQLVKALKKAIELGLRLPIVYNCGGYEEVETIKLLDGIVDIYMPDIKYGSEEAAKKYSNAPDYFTKCQEAVKEMHSQVGDLKMDDRGIAYRGLLIRHLVLPNGLAGSKEVLEFIVKKLSPDSYVNIMDQYRPMFRAGEYRELSRTITRDEFYKVINLAKEMGLNRFRRDYSLVKP